MSNSKGEPANPLNPKTTSYEFLGPPGAFLITFGVPIFAYVLYFTCNDSSGGCPPPVDSLYPSLVQAVSDPAFWWKLWDPKAFVCYYSWYALCLLAWAVLPGDWVQGTKLRNGEYQRYKINGTISRSDPFFFLKLMATVLNSAFHVSSGPRFFHWMDPTLWRRLIYALLRPLDWLYKCRFVDVLPSSHSLLRALLPRRKVASPWWQQWQFHL